ncbi:tetratricopeptide repeat protein [Spirosoma sp. SC4-14]|uniref:tetratricopeptide repeat-containing sensor histidine kinase n=1 Tax=Spirosoma sp. SC4-14 TaxID=3128900 RepID=UPI0030D21B08
MSNTFLKACLVFWLLTQFLATCGWAQLPKSLDSLAQYLKTARRDTNYVNALNDFGWKLIFEKAAYDSTIVLARQAESLAVRLKFNRGIYTAHHREAAAYFHKNDLPKALAYFQKTLEDVKRFGLSKRQQVVAMGNVALVYSHLNQPQKAIDTALAAIRFQEAQQLPEECLSAIYPTIGLMLKQTGHPAQALPYYRKAVAIDRAMHDSTGIAISNNHIGNIYDDLNNPAQALTSYKASLRGAEAVGYELLQIDALQNIGRMYDKLGQAKQGLPYLFRAVKLAEKQNADASVTRANYNIAGLYQSLHDYPNAERYALKALAMAEKNEDGEAIVSYRKGIAEIYAEQKKYQQAYSFLNQSYNFTDSMATAQAKVEVQKLIAGYETEKKEARLRLLQKEAQLRQRDLERSQFQATALLVGGALLLLLGGAVSAWLLNRARLRRLQEAQQLRQQIAQDLHDEVGSTLSSISLLSGHTDTLLSQNRPESAQKMVQKIYQDARQILESIDEIIWTINPGNDSLPQIALRLQEYAQPLMESKHIRFSFAIDPSFDMIPISMEVRRNLYLIGKEAINNLVKYSGATEATVRFESQQGRLQVLIQDNGHGFDPARPSARTGQQSMNQRAQAMSGSLDVHSGTGAGTTVRLLVPIG